MPVTCYGRYTPCPRKSLLLSICKTRTSDCQGHLLCCSVRKERAAVKKMLSQPGQFASERQYSSSIGPEKELPTFRSSARSQRKPGRTVTTDTFYRYCSTDPGIGDVVLVPVRSLKFRLVAGGISEGVIGNRNPSLHPEGCKAKAGMEPGYRLLSLVETARKRKAIWSIKCKFTVFPQALCNCNTSIQTIQHHRA